MDAAGGLADTTDEAAMLRRENNELQAQVSDLERRLEDAEQRARGVDPNRMQEGDEDKRRGRAGNRGLRVAATPRGGRGDAVGPGRFDSLERSRQRHEEAAPTSQRGRADVAKRSRRRRGAAAVRGRIR